MNFSDLIPAEEIWRESLLAKMRGYLDQRTYQRLDSCGRENLFRACRSCQAVETFPYRCNLKWCPLCNWRISRRREELLAEWVTHVQQPKHLVLTRQNFDVLTRSRVQSHGKDVSALRRTKAFADVSGGCCSTEITNSGNGWHLHTHLLVDTRWLNMPMVERAWSKRIKQPLSILKVKDARSKDYLGEVCKYVCKPAEMVSWKPDDIWHFIKAIERTRFFATFGSLFVCGPEVRRAIAIRKNESRSPQVCDCGCDEFIWRDATSQTLHDLRSSFQESGRRGKSRSPKTARTVTPNAPPEPSLTFPVLPPR